MLNSISLPKQTFDWTKDAEPPTEYCRFVRDYNFTPTPLGPIKQWPQLLRQHVCQTMIHPYPRVLAWGPQLCLLHNEAARRTSVDRSRAERLGQPILDVWSEIHATGLANQLREVIETGRAIHTPDMLLLLGSDREELVPSAKGGNVSQTECYLDICLSPCFDSDCSVAGVLLDFSDVTRSVLADRRFDVIEQIEHNLSCETETNGLWDAMMFPLKGLKEDVPFAVGYSVMPQTLGSLPMKDRLVYESSFGLEFGHPLIETLRNDERVIQLLQGAWTVDIPPFVPGMPPKSRDEVQDRRILYSARNRPTETRVTQGIKRTSEENSDQADGGSPLPPGSLLELGEPIIIPGRGFDAYVSSVIVIVVPRRNPPDPFGVLILGMNPLRPFDREYQCAINLLKSIIINNITSIVYPKMMRRVADRLQMTEQRAQKSVGIEQGLKNLVKVAPFGISFWSRVNGSTYRPDWNNDGWNDLFGINDGDNPSMDTEADKDGLNMRRFRFKVHPDDEPAMQASWQALLQGTATGQLEIRVLRNKPHEKTQWEFQWVLLQYTHHYHRESGLHSIGAWAIDITTQKTSELVQAQRVEDALEAKRVTEHFIDMVSHELRNPMSAMFQAAELVGCMAKSVVSIVRNDIERLPHLCTTLLESSDVIMLCTQHQKRIVDDILTLSKLDARLLIIVPEPVNVPSLMQQLNNIYEMELKKAGIESCIEIDQSYRDMQLNEIMLDPGRLLQILMNIFSNSQKFTRQSPEKKITFHIGASFTRPEKTSDGRRYLAFRNEGLLKNDEQRAAKNVRDNTQETIFLSFSVQDTGRGMSPAELRQLFKKFSQASPKTHGKYGGSGLGLFITRDLVELQGGQIAVSSKVDCGTTFSFYIKAERVLTPEIKRPRLTKRPSFTAMLSDIKSRKGSMERATTAIREKRRTPSPGESERGHSPEPVTTPTYRFSSPESPGYLEDKFRHWPVHILLVEDNLINQRILAQQLRKEGYPVATADNGLEAVQFVKQSSYASQPETAVRRRSVGNSAGATPVQEQSHFTTPKPLTLILMDIEMPIMNGLEATRTIRALEDDGLVTGHIPILAVTANAKPAHVQGARDAGMDDVLTKPFRITEILKKMSDLLDAMGSQTSATGMVPF